MNYETLRDADGTQFSPLFFAQVVVENAITDADIIVTATSAQAPLLKANWVKPGALQRVRWTRCPSSMLPLQSQL